MLIEPPTSEEKRRIMRRKKVTNESYTEWLHNTHVTYTNKSVADYFIVLFSLYVAFDLIRIKQNSQQRSHAENVMHEMKRMEFN